MDSLREFMSTRDCWSRMVPDGIPLSTAINQTKLARPVGEHSTLAGQNRGYF